MLSYPPELPITAKSSEIIGAIRENQVVIISGETGCGKSTQIPKMCLEAGISGRGRIGHTQPRRIAAITIAHRIAEELGEKLGRSVGYKIRFENKTSAETRVKILTDGMLLAETQSDPRLLEYDALIIDEAHERSLNIDFLLGIAKTLLPLRRELKLIITSATLDIEKFSRAFSDPPVLEVSGRMYPVDVEYRPPRPEDFDDGDTDYVGMAVKAVDYLRAEKAPGDVLIFMPTEQDILETCEILEGRRYHSVTVLPLFARLPAPQQGRVYSVQGPKIVVATNVAETSLTIPGIKYVIDTGLARVSQYLPVSRINSLPIRAVSKSSADQRKGRCGRVQEGLCVRLYSEEDYASRPQFTPPEILRSNLAEVILRMIDLNLGDPLKFPFVDRPLAKNVEDGYAELVELGAIVRRGEDYVLTARGRLMARMPVDPRISRMLLEAQKEGCLREVAVIASVLSIRDPRERPPDKAGQADAMHAPFRDPDSDFLTLLNIWDRYHAESPDLASQSRKRKFCHESFLSYPRMREWTFIHNELTGILKELRIPLGRTAPAEMSKDLYAAIHRSILSGYLSNIAVHKERNIYTAAKGREVMVFPGSTLFGKNATWIAAAEMVRTSRLFARVAARIQSEWLEDLGGDLCRYSYQNVRWDKDKGQVLADERAELFSLEIVSGRPIPYGRIDPDESHRVFVRAALVDGRIKGPLDFLRHNLDLRGRLSTIEDKLRKRDILVDEKALEEFYSKRLAGVYDLRGLKNRIARRGGSGFLFMKETDLLRVFPDPEELSLFPDDWTIRGKRLKVTYKFAPGDPDDGATLTVLLELLSRLPEESLQWGIPGYFNEKIEALIKGLPKRYRKLFVPVSDAARAVIEEMDPSEGSLFSALSAFVKQRFRADVPVSAWAGVDLPPHLKMRVSVVDHAGQEVAAGRDFETLRKLRREAVSAAARDPETWIQAGRKWERTGITSWDFGEMPEIVSIGSGVVAFPGLEPAAGDKVNLRLFKTPEQALASHKKGVAALLLLRFSKDLKFVQKRLALPVEHLKTALYFGGKDAFERMLLDNLKKEVFEKNIRTEAEFKATGETVVRELFEKSQALLQAVGPILEAYQETHVALYAIEKTNPENKALADICSEIRKDMDRLVPKNFLEIYGLERLAQLPRYLDALRLRADRAQNDLEKDRRKAAQAEPFLKTLEKLRASIKADSRAEEKAAVEEFRWMVEEFKVSLFAPEVKTPFPISPTRLTARLKEIEKLKA